MDRKENNRAYTADEIIKHLDLKPLEREGGWFKFMYKSDIEVQQSALPSTFKKDHVCASYIYYLLKKDEVSALHMLSSDEVWFWLAGGTLKMRVSNTDELIHAKEILIGSDFIKENISYLVKGNTWQTTEVVEGDYVLVACVVVPSFDQEEYFMKGESNV